MHIQPALYITNTCSNFFPKYQASGQALELVCTARDSLYILSAL